MSGRLPWSTIALSHYSERFAPSTQLPSNRRIAAAKSLENFGGAPYSAVDMVSMRGIGSGILCGLPFLFVSLLVASSACAEQPNVVLIISDDQAWTDFGFMGHPEIRTPHLDALARQGAVFTRGYVPASLCRCSLATLITGLYPHQHGITSNDPPEGVERHAMLRLIAGQPTLPGLLRAKGYRSLQTGKWWEGNYRLGGFTDGMTHGDPERGGRHGDVGLDIGRKGLQPIFDFVESCGDTPFFIWYAPFLPHRPHTPPEKYLAKYRKPGRSEHVAKYWAMCEWFDATIGELLDFLDEREIADNTIVAFVADNGWIQRTDDPGFAPRSKRSPYDGGLRTPLIIRWPGRVMPSWNDETPVISLDLATTILRACGVEPTVDMPGIDLIELASGRTQSTRDAIFGEVFTHDAVDLDRPSSSLLYRWCIQGGWKVILPQSEDERPELYAIVDDPMETEDLARQNPAVVKRLTELVDAWWPGG